MKFAIFMGCKIPYYLEQYGESTKAIFKTFGVDLAALDFNCCGYPNRDFHFESYILSAARNMALAEKQGLDIVTPCKCCFGSLKHANHWLKENESLRTEINSELGKEKLTWSGTTEIKHIFSVLAHDVGLDTIKARVQQPQTGLKVAAHYGCHALRPSKIMQFDNPFAPTIFE
ncbi:MAG: disulfide reductase, partial [bacterium]|nr:disulfide reductase [bacterium]